MGNLTRKLLQKAKKYSIDMEKSSRVHYATLPCTHTHSNGFSQWVGHLHGNFPGNKGVHKHFPLKVAFGIILHKCLFCERFL